MNQTKIEECARKRAASYAEILLAYSRGEVVEVRPDTSIDVWYEVSEFEEWDFSAYDYRIKEKVALSCDEELAEIKQKLASLEAKIDQQFESFYDGRAEALRQSLGSGAVIKPT